MSFVLGLLLAVLFQNTTIQGIIVKGTNDPLSKATVELRTNDNDARIVATTTTGEDGRFILSNIPPARYRLTVARSGYTRPPLLITLLPGQPVSDLRLLMAPTGAIYGFVYGEKGRPLGNAEVSAYKATYSEGRRVLTGVEAVKTNDLGEYRLFWLPPGRYYVSASHPQLSDRRLMVGTMSLSMGPSTGAFSSMSTVDPAVATAAEEAANPERYVPVYFPGTTNEQSAVPVDLHANTDSGPVNIVVAPVQPRHVRGFIIDGTTGRPGPYSNIEVAQDAPRLFGGRREDPRIVNPDTGAFDVTLLPGTHTLTATSSNGSASVTIEVGGADIDNLTVVTSPYFNLTGQIVSKDRLPTADIEQLRLTLRRIPPLTQETRSRTLYSQPRSDGAFLLEASSGDFRVNIAPILNIAPLLFPETIPKSLQNAYVKSIRFGNVDALNGSIHIEGPSTTVLEIELANNPGSVDGIAGKSDVTVALVPDVRGRFDLYKSAITDAAGRFHFDHVPPGSYKVFAWTEVDGDSWLDPDFMRSVENLGAAVQVTEGTASNLRIQPID